MGSKRDTLAYRHVLEIFLLDRDDGVRNVYGSGLLDSEWVLNDLRTLAPAGSDISVI
jgi:hypothetical protein